MRTHRSLAIPETLAEALDPGRSALLVHDVQGGVLRQIEGAQGVIDHVGEARAAGVRVAFVRHRSLPLAWTGAMGMRTALRWRRTDDPEAVSPWFLPGSPGFEIAPEVAPRDDEPVIDKIVMSAFEGTFLAHALRDCGVTTVAVCGVATEIRADVTCRRVADLGFMPVLIEDACAPGHAEAGARAVETLRFLGDTMVTDVAGHAGALGAP